MDLKYIEKILKKYGLIESDLVRVREHAKRYPGGQSLESLDKQFFECPFQVVYLMQQNGYAFTQDHAYSLVENWGPQTKQDIDGLAEEFPEEIQSEDNLKFFDLSENEQNRFLKAWADEISKQIEPTNFETICKILCELYERIRSKDKYVLDYVADSDFWQNSEAIEILTTTKSYLLNEIKLKRKDKKRIMQAWERLLHDFETVDTSFETLEDIFNHD